ncbi:MAG: prenyltransferase/squalene oxidase repeat-containing protein, partial [Pirellulales bacterium]
MHLRAPALTLMLMALAWLAEPQRADGQVEAEQVRVAIERGVTYLRREQRLDGSWPEHPGVPSGITSLCTLAMLNSGVPADDPQVQSSLNYLRKQQLSMTYGVALQTMVFCAAEPKTSQALVR